MRLLGRRLDLPQNAPDRRAHWPDWPALRSLAWSLREDDQGLHLLFPALNLVSLPLPPSHPSSLPLPSFLRCCSCVPFALRSSACLFGIALCLLSNLGPLVFWYVHAASVINFCILLPLACAARAALPSARLRIASRSPSIGACRAAVCLRCARCPPPAVAVAGDEVPSQLQIPGQLSSSPARAREAAAPAWPACFFSLTEGDARSVCRQRGALPVVS